MIRKPTIVQGKKSYTHSSSSMLESQRIRFANPAEATGGSEAWRLGGMDALQMLGGIGPQTTNIRNRIRYRKMMRKSMKIRLFLVVLEVKTLPDRPPEATGSPGGSQESPQRVPWDLPGSPRRPRAALWAPKVAQGRPKGRPKLHPTDVQTNAAPSKVRASCGATPRIPSKR